ncbi:helix-turn-helix transcriptional regulator [Clostridium sp.]|uniref:helix-turn-helix transcriptional regulator n=1 Tax=Clostridium sp. TaxID=1506 RepID=UPI00290CA777|nr:helix-turn-helix transcriptional regulator [Clostridium sp.]MDU4726455.1 helix-turn-helix transcriptional regulator [Clostridium sp.]
MNLSDKVKYLRKVELKMTQSEFAKLCGVSRSYISEIEQGRIVGNLSLITKLSKVTNKPIEYFTNSSKDIKVHSYEVLDNIINSFIDNGLISEDGEMDKDTEDFLNKTLKKEILYKLSLNKSKK